jgi:hypothetical protein
VSAAGVVGGAEVLPQGGPVGQHDLGAVDGHQAEAPPADDVAIQQLEPLGQQEEEGDPEFAGHALPRLGESLLGDRLGWSLARVVAGLLTGGFAGRAEERGQQRARERLVI